MSLPAPPDMTINPGLAIEVVVAVPAVERVVASAAVERVVAGAAVERVIAGKTHKEIVELVAGEDQPGCAGLARRYSTSWPACRA